jgi:hypothetical protein
MGRRSLMFGSGLVGGRCFTRKECIVLLLCLHPEGELGLFPSICFEICIRVKPRE